MKTKRFRKGEKVWFVDSDETGAYPEWGDFEARTTDGRIVIQAYFGLFMLPIEYCYHSKKECQEAIDKKLKEVEDE